MLVFLGSKNEGILPNLLSSRPLRSASHDLNRKSKQMTMGDNRGNRRRQRNLWFLSSFISKLNRCCGLVVSAIAQDGTGCEFDSWQCRIYIPCSLSLRLLGSLRGSLGTYGLTQKLCWKKKKKTDLFPVSSPFAHFYAFQQIS